jgi:3-hydroxyacyl-[acyl-carrier-protein] dehydratase
MTMQNSIAAARVSGPSPQSDGGVGFEFRFPANDPVFAGHFPGRPILPGVFQLEMARVAAELALGFRLAVREISKAKFQRPILPEELVRVDLKLSEKDGSIHARAGFSVGAQPAGETQLLLWRND